MLSVIDLSLQKAQRQLLAELDWQLESGQMLAVVGPNGAGKSSLLKCLAGLWAASDGAVMLDDLALASLPLSERAGHVGWLAQQSYVAFDFSVAQVVALGPQQAAPSVMRSAMQTFGVLDYADRNIAELSGGQQQRVHLARVFSQLNSSEAASQCLLLDEPLNGLDIRWQQRCLSAAQDWLSQRPNRHVVMALHDIGLAASSCDQVLVLNEGMIEFMGAPAALDEDLLEKVWRYPLTIQRGNAENNYRTLVYPK
jgi:iron complex transport system ATP-binding protein